MYLTKDSLLEDIENPHETNRKRQSNKKCTTELNRHFAKKEYIQVSYRQKKRSSTSLVIGEMQIKTTISITVHSPQWLKFKEHEKSKCW